MKRPLLTLLIISLCNIYTLAQSLEKNVEERLKHFFSNYQTSYANIGSCDLESYTVDHEQRKLTIYNSGSFPERK